MGRAKVKYEIDVRKDHFIIFRGKQRHVMTAMVWQGWVAELVCATLNTWEAVATITQLAKVDNT